MRAALRKNSGARGRAGSHRAPLNRAAIVRESGHRIAGAVLRAAAARRRAGGGGDVADVIRRTRNAAGVALRPRLCRRLGQDHGRQRAWRLAALQGLHADADGSSVNIASLAYAYGMSFGQHHAIFKAAVMKRGLGRGRFDAVAPSAVKPEGTDGLEQEGEVPRSRGRRAQPAAYRETGDLTGMLVHLASDLSRLVAGQTADGERRFRSRCGVGGSSCESGRFPLYQSRRP